jgi:hypothetical protein
MTQMRAESDQKANARSRIHHGRHAGRPRRAAVPARPSQPGRQVAALLQDADGEGPRRGPAVLNDDPVLASAAQSRNKPNKPNKPKYRGRAPDDNPPLVT